MSTLLTLGLANAACAALLAVPAFLVGRYAKRPALAHALWLLVLLKLVTPPFVRPGLAWLPAEERRAGDVMPPVVTLHQPGGLTSPARQTLPTPRRDLVVRQMTTSSGVILSSPPATGQAVFLLATPPPKTKALPPEPDRAGGLADLAVMVWLTGAILFLGRALFYAARFHGLLSHGRAAPAYIQEQAEALANEMGLRRCPRVWLVPGALPPMVWGVGWVRLLFPEGLLTRLSDSERASLLTHELAHVHRRDHWVRLLELAALTLFWWFPLAWWAKRQLQAREEECCDAWAAGAVPPRVYATAILEAVDFLAEARPRLPVMASALESKRSLKQRLTLILTTPAPRRLGWVTRLALVAVAAAVLPLVPTLVEAKKAAPPTAEGDPEPTAFTVSTVDFLAPAQAKISVRLAAVGMAVSPDGKTVAVGEEGGQIRLLNPRNGDLLRTLKGHDDAVTALAFSRDGKRLASSGPDTVVKVWQVADGKLSRSLTGHGSWVYSLAFSRDGKRLASGSYDRSVRVWPLDGGEARVLDGHRASVRALVFGRDDKTLFSGGTDRAIRVWDLATWKGKTISKDHDGDVRGLALVDGGKALISAGGDGYVRRYDLATGKETKSVKAAAEGQLVSLALSPGERTLALGNEGGSVMLYDAETLSLRVTQASVHRDGVPALGFLPGATRLFSLGGDRTLKAWEGEPGPLLRLTGHKGPVRHAVYSPDGRWILSCGGWPEGDRRLRLWDAATGQLIRDVVYSQKQLTAVAWSPDGKHAVVGGDGGLVQMWDVTQPTLVRTFEGHKDGVPHLSVSADGKRLVTASHDKTVKVWNVETGAAEQTMTGHTGAVRVAVFHPDGKRVVSGSWDKTVRVWDRGTGRETSSFVYADAKVERVALLPDGKRLMVVGESVPRLYDLATGSPLREYGAYANGSTGLDVSPDGRLALTCGYGGAARLWDVESGAQLRQFAGHRGTVWSARFSPDGKAALTSGGGTWVNGKPVPGDDFALRVWRLPKMN
jgi:WD40 repeat protein/beta-lactamase regulating signal transducer with metallopeptidase domain